MIYLLEDTSKVEELFTACEDSLVTSCLQKVMGKIYVTDPDSPKSAMAILTNYVYFAGEANKELASSVPEGRFNLIPLSEEWTTLIKECFPKAKKRTRYSLKKDTKFNRKTLEGYASSLSEGYELKRVDSAIFDMLKNSSVFEECVMNFDSKEQYFELGRGTVIMKNGRIVSACSSYTAYIGGIEIEIITAEEERRKGLALAVSAALILTCLDDGLYPTWDAANLASVRLAEKLGYEFKNEYYSYLVE